MMERTFISTEMNPNIKLLDETKYEYLMQNEVEPMLKKIGITGYFERKSTEKIYYEQYLVDNAKAAIVISHGFIESSEKYKEMIYYFLQQNYDVFVLDHRGHGLSHREVSAKDLVHIGDFEDYVRDFCYFAEKIVAPKAEGHPLYLYGHSMGGGIGARCLEEHPTLFAKAILTAPMLKINSGKIPEAVCHILAKIHVFFKNGKSRVFIQKIFNKNECFEDGPCTSQPRFKYYFNKRLSNENLQTNAATYNWVKESLKITKKIREKENCEKVKIPVLVFTAENDTYVLEQGQKEFVSKIENGELVFVPNTKHEIYLSENSVMSVYLSKIFEFYEK